MALARIPAGLTYAMIVAAFSLGVVTTCWNFSWPLDRGPALIAHACAWLCLVWTLAAYLTAQARGDALKPGRTQDLIDVLYMGGVVTGLVTVLIMLFAAVTEIIFRTVWFRFEHTLQLEIWPSGFFDLAAIACALIVGWRRARNQELVTALFWVLILASAWLSFQIPATRPVTAEGVQPVRLTDWAGVFMLLAAGVTALFTIVAGIRRRRHRQRAWPDALWLLTEPPAPWPGFHYSAGIVSVAVLLLGCPHLLLPWTGLAAIMAGVSVLTLAHRHWNENLADAGLALITLAVTSLVTLPFGRPDAWTPVAWASLFNQVLLGLALMTGVWYWLSKVWEQQLNEGEAWTTTGRLVRTSQRVGYLVGSFAVLVSLHLSFWPRFPAVLDLDASPGRWAWALSANVILILMLTFAARRTRRATVGWLVLFTVASVGMFAVVRTPHAWLGKTWTQHWQMILAIVACLMILLARLVSSRPNWQAFWEPAYLTGIFVAPMASIAGLVAAQSSPFQSMTILPPLPTLTFAWLGLAYLLAAVMLGPRQFYTVAALCAIVSIWSLRRVSGETPIDPVYFHTMLVGLVMAIIGSVLASANGAKRLQIVKWIGITVAMLAIAAGVITRGSP